MTYKELHTKRQERKEFGTLIPWTIFIIIATLAFIFFMLFMLFEVKHRIGYVASDGYSSSATGSGAGSRHGGVDHWIYKVDVPRFQWGFGVPFIILLFPIFYNIFIAIYRKSEVMPEVSLKSHFIRGLNLKDGKIHEKIEMKIWSIKNSDFMKSKPFMNSEINSWNPSDKFKEEYLRKLCIKWYPSQFRITGYDAQEYVIWSNNFIKFDGRVNAGKNNNFILLKTFESRYSAEIRRAHWKIREEYRKTGEILFGAKHPDDYDTDCFFINKSEPKKTKRREVRQDVIVHRHTWIYDQDNNKFVCTDCNKIHG